MTFGVGRLVHLETLEECEVNTRGGAIRTYHTDSSQYKFGEGAPLRGSRAATPQSGTQDEERESVGERGGEGGGEETTLPAAISPLRTVAGGHRFKLQRRRSVDATSIGTSSRSASRERQRRASVTSPLRSSARAGDAEVV